MKRDVNIKLQTTQNITFSYKTICFILNSFSLFSNLRSFAEGSVVSFPVYPTHQMKTYFKVNLCIFQINIHVKSLDVFV